jgi:hypothetical protein
VAKTISATVTVCGAEKRPATSPRSKPILADDSFLGLDLLSLGAEHMS